jgi:hypothetical protein
MTDEQDVRGPTGDAQGSDADAAGATDTKTGTFLVTHADDDSAVLTDVHDGQVHTLAANPGLAADEAVTGTLRPVPPMAVAWAVDEIDERWAISVEDSDLAPTRQEREIADGQAVGELTRQERAGEGELHVITVPEEGVEQAVADVLDDAAGLRSRAARLGVNRVEVRSAAGVVSVRYVP